MNGRAAAAAAVATINNSYTIWQQHPHEPTETATTTPTTALSIANVARCVRASVCIQVFIYFNFTFKTQLLFTSRLPGLMSLWSIRAECKYLRPRNIWYRNTLMWSADKCWGDTIILCKSDWSNSVITYLLLLFRFKDLIFLWGQGNCYNWKELMYNKTKMMHI